MNVKTPNAGLGVILSSNKYYFTILMILVEVLADGAGVVTVTLI
jgi:hypothetical protein